MVALGIVTYLATTTDEKPPLPAESTDGNSRASDVSTPGVAEPGDAAPDFRAEGLDGGTVRLAEFRGQAVVLNFWASWCQPCRREFPLLRGIHETDDAVVVGVVFNDIPSDAAAFVDDFDATWPQALDEDRQIARAYGVRSIPQTIFINADGTIEDRLYGEIKSDDALLRRVRELGRSS